MDDVLDREDTVLAEVVLDDLVVVDGERWRLTLA